MLAAAKLLKAKAAQENATAGDAPAGDAPAGDAAKAPALPAGKAGGGLAALLGGGGMFKVAAAAAKFKKGGERAHQVSKEKRELIKKVEGYSKWKTCGDKMTKAIQDLIKPHIKEPAKSGNDDSSDSEDSSDGGAQTVESQILSGIQNALKSFNDDAINACIDAWEVEKQTKRLQTVQDHLEKKEKDNRKAHHEFMMELSGLKTQLYAAQAAAQDRAAGKEVKITSSDIVFYEATEYLEEDQRQLVKEIVEYKIREELARGTDADKLGDSLSALKKKLKDSQEQLEVMKQQDLDNQSMLTKLRSEITERAKADLEKQMVGEEEKEVEPTKPIKKEQGVQTDEGVEHGCMPMGPDDWGCARETQTDASNNHVEIQTDPDDELQSARESAKSAEEMLKHSAREVSGLREMNDALQLDLTRVQEQLRQLQEAGDCKFIEKPKPPMASISMQTDHWEPGPSAQETELLLSGRDTRIKELQDALEALEKERADLLSEAQALRLASKKGAGVGDEEFAKSEAERKRLQKRNKELDEEVAAAAERNTMLEIAINELRDKLKTLQDQLRAAGMGEIADRMFDSAGLAEILSNKPLSVFDRLYNDALKRVRRMEGYKEKRRQEQQAMTSTFHTIENPQPPRPIDPNTGLTVQTAAGGYGSYNKPGSPDASRRSPSPPGGQGVDAEPQEEVKICVNTRVRCLSGMQIKSGARTVQVPKGALGTCVQLYPSMAIDWDCLPSVDKMIVQPDMVQGIIDRPRSQDRGFNSASQREPSGGRLGSQGSPSITTTQFQMPIMVQETAAAPPLRTRQPSPQRTHGDWPAPASRAPQVPAGLPQVSLAGLSKSFSSPQFSLDSPSKASQAPRRLPRLDSPSSPSRVPAGNLNAMRQAGLNPTFEAVSFIAGAGVGPAPPLRPSSVGRIQGKGAAAAEDATPHRTSPVRILAQAQSGGGSKTRSRSQPPVDFMVSGEHVAPLS